MHAHTGLHLENDKVLGSPVAQYYSLNYLFVCLLAGFIYCSHLAVYFEGHSRCLQKPDISISGSYLFQITRDGYVAAMKKACFSTS